MIPTDDAMTNKLIGERYELLEVLGEGGFATTYRAWDSRLERAVAIKILRHHYATDKQFVDRFVREARAAASVSHPNVVRLYDFGQDSETVFIAMQYVQGETLRELLRRHPAGLNESEAIRLAAPVVRGLAAIHAVGIVHRDIKPDNVLLAHDGEVLITDFGIALIADSGRMTRTDTTYGTAAYMAPEQARGDVPGPATDVYSAGVMLFELLTGRLPFDAVNPVAMMMAHQEQTPPPVSQFAPGGRVSPPVQAAVHRALAKQPHARFQSGADFLAALTSPLPTTRPTERLDAATLPLPALPRPRSQPAPSSPKRVRRSSAAGWVFAVLLLAGAAAAIAAYAAGLFDDSLDPTQPAIVAPTSTVEVIEAPTIASIETPTDDVIVETDTAVADVPTPTPAPDDEPGIIVSAVPDGSPPIIEPVHTGGD